jgi:hypothetical protein
VRRGVCVPELVFSPLLMIVRIRTNCGLWKTTIPSADITVQELIEAISAQHNINRNAITLLTSDDNAIRYDEEPLRTLASYQIKHGDLIKIGKKLKLIEVEKAYIEDGQLVPVGKSYCLDENDNDPPEVIPVPSSVPVTLNRPSVAISPPSTSPAVAAERTMVKDEDPYSAQVQEKVATFLSLDPSAFSGSCSTRGTSCWDLDARFGTLFPIWPPCPRL